MIISELSPYTCKKQSVMIAIPNRPELDPGRMSLDAPIQKQDRNSKEWLLRLRPLPFNQEDLNSYIERMIDANVIVETLENQMFRWCWLAGKRDIEIQAFDERVEFLYGKGRTGLV